MIQGKHEGSILIVDDEADIRWVLRRILEENDYSVSEAAHGEAALAMLEKDLFDVAIIDLRMPRMDGMTLLKKVRQKYPDLMVIILSAFGDINSAVEATKLGAFHFLVKPANEEIIRVTVKNALEKARLNKRIEQLEGQLPKIQSGSIIGHSAAIQNALHLVEKVAPTDMTVLFTGESGTGKELFATLIHRNSDRVNKPFIPVDGGAFPETLAESELFGYEKGSFTGANSRRIGKFELAHEGTLFLDEIGNMTVDVQAKILRAIEQKRIFRVGGRDLIPVDVRIIAATNADLETMVKNERFRSDLYFRLSAFVIDIPALRDRREDIPVLIDYFLSISKWASSDNYVPDETMEILLAYDWPGNIRELKHCMDRALLVTSGPIMPGDLPPNLMKLKTMVASPIEFKSLKDAGEYGARREEEQLIKQTLERTAWNRNETAQLLGVDVKTLYNKMKKYGIIDPPPSMDR